MTVMLVVVLVMMFSMVSFIVIIITIVMVFFVVMIMVIIWDNFYILNELNVFVICSSVWWMHSPESSMPLL